MFRRSYPYLDSSYKNNINEQTSRRQFLQKIDDFLNQKQYVRITLLNWQEEGIKEIQGELTSGSISKDGASTVRRTCNLGCTVNGGEYNVDDIKMDFSINKKVFIEIGIKNYTDEYPEYEYLFFPQGVFFITNLNISSSSTTTVNLTLNLKDKMAGLNGEIGGTFPASTILDSVDTQTESGEYITEKVLIYQIIQELVNHFGGEPINNIVIEDVPLRIQRIMKWTGSNPLWMEYTGNVDNGFSYQFKVETPDSDKQDSYTKFINGDDVGYIYDNFYYTGELTMAAGESVCNALDKLVQYLGNYEYFYDEFGVFHFREIKNYLNTTQATTVLDAADSDNYLVDITTGKSIFNFEDDKNLINITVNPQYSNIKNDFIVEGLRKGTTSNISYPIRYHLAIDYKPSVGHAYTDLLFYKSPIDGLTKIVFPKRESRLPNPGNFNVIYMLDTSYTENETEYKAFTGKEGGNVVYFWSESNEYIEIEPIKYISPDSDEPYITKDWRTEIYLRGLLANNLGTDASQYYFDLKNNNGSSNKEYPWLDDLFNIAKQEKIDVDFYYTELQAFWPQIYDLVNQKFWAEEEGKPMRLNALSQGDWYLDFIDPSTSGLGEFCVSNIGRRTLVLVNSEINCLFDPYIPQVNFILIRGNSEEEIKAQNDAVQECIDNGIQYSQVRSEVYHALATGGYHFSCFEQIKYQLFLHTNYAKTLSLIALPAFYLEPNSRVTVNDNSTRTYGDYMITNITIPFGAGNSMSVTASECNMDRLQ